MKIKYLPKRIILFQIICGLLFAFAANPLLLRHYYASFLPVQYCQTATYFQILFISLLLMRAIWKYRPLEREKVLANKGIGYFSSYCTVFIAASFEFLLLFYLFLRFVVSKKVEVFEDLLIPMVVLYIAVCLVSFILKKKKNSSRLF